MLIEVEDNLFIEYSSGRFKLKKYAWVSSSERKGMLSKRKQVLIDLSDYMSMRELSEEFGLNRDKVYEQFAEWLDEIAHLE